MSLPAFYPFDDLDPLDWTNGYDSFKSLVIDFILVCQCFTGLMACCKNLKFHVIGVHVNALRLWCCKDLEILSIQD